MIRVENIEAAALYYADVFGLHPRWSGDGSIGLVFQETDAEICAPLRPEYPLISRGLLPSRRCPCRGSRLCSTRMQSTRRPFRHYNWEMCGNQRPIRHKLCILDMTKGARPLNLAGSTR